MRWKNHIEFSAGFMTFLLTAPTVALASSNPLNDLFHPLQYLDIGSFYDQYHYWIDFFIFLCLFISVGKITLGRRFGGREGKVLSAVVGLVLALSLSLLEYRVGFSIKSFGPFAAGILIFLVGLVIFYLVKSFGAGTVSSGSFAFAITYFLVRASLPELFLWAEDNPLFALLHLVLFVVFMVSIFKIVGSLFSGKGIKSLGRTLMHSPNPDSNLRKNIDNEKREIHLIKSDLRRTTKKGGKESSNIIEQLEEMIRIIEKYGSTDRARHLIADKINVIASKENLILKQLAYLKDLSERIENFDLKLFRELRARWDRVPDRDKDILKEEILLEKNKIISEEELRKLESVLSKYDNNFRLCLSNAVQCLKSNQPSQARDWLFKAIKCEEGAMNIFKEMKELENRLLKLTRREFKTFKKEWKDEKG
jgi:hypothetical protein